MIKKYLPQIIILVLLLAWYGFFICQKIDLTTADLGRHLKNGEIALSNFNSGFLKTNFYSFTHPEYPFVNHHWLSGVMFFFVWKISGFVGLSLFYIVLSFFTFSIFFHLARKMSNTAIAFVVSLLLVPLIAEREEIRPEIFSYVFSALFFWILWNYKENKISSKFLFFLPAIGLIWVNSHIYFFLGPCFIALFILEKLIKQTLLRPRYGGQVKKLSIALLGTLAVSFLNPLGLKTLLYPLNIFKNYGYKIIENQSIWFLENLGFIKIPNLLLFKITFLLLVASFIILIILNRKRFSFSLLILTIVFSSLGWLAIRNFTVFGFFALPILSYNFYVVFEKYKKKLSLNAQDAIMTILVITILAFTVLNNYQKISLKKNAFGLGLMPQNNASAEFFQKQEIKGLIFNNYDIGSYLIFHFPPDKKVYVDNRPEAYPVSFFENIYIPAQENNKKWENLLQQYDFNAIFFARHDATPWGQKFLIERIKDPKWAPIFVDTYSIIFVKRNETNKEIIKQYEIPNEAFHYNSNI